MTALQIRETETSNVTDATDDSDLERGTFLLTKTNKICDADNLYSVDTVVDGRHGRKNKLDTHEEQDEEVGVWCKNIQNNIRIRPA